MSDRAFLKGIAMNKMIAIRTVRGLGFTRQEVLQRDDPLTREGSSAFAHFAYIADDGRIATQEPGELPILHDADVFGVTVYAPLKRSA